MKAPKHIADAIRIKFPEDMADRTQHVIEYLRNDKAKDEHVPGSLTLIGRCAVDHAAAEIIEELQQLVPGIAYWVILEESETHTLCECSHCKDIVLMHGEGYLTKYCPTCGWSMKYAARHL